MKPLEIFLEDIPHSVYNVFDCTLKNGGVFGFDKQDWFVMASRGWRLASLIIR